MNEPEKTTEQLLHEIEEGVAKMRAALEATFVPEINIEALEALANTWAEGDLPVDSLAEETPDEKALARQRSKEDVQKKRREMRRRKGKL